MHLVITVNSIAANCPSQGLLAAISMLSSKFLSAETVAGIIPDSAQPYSALRANEADSMDKLLLNFAEIVHYQRTVCLFDMIVCKEH